MPFQTEYILFIIPPRALVAGIVFVRSVYASSIYVYASEEHWLFCS